MGAEVKLGFNPETAIVSLIHQMEAFSRGELFVGNNMKELVTMMKTNLGGVGGENIQRVNDFMPMFYDKLFTGLQIKNKPPVFLHVDIVYDIYKMFVGELIENFSIGILNFINLNIDYIYLNYYEALDPASKEKFKRDIETFKFSCNIDDKYIVVLCVLSQVIYDVISSGNTLWQHMDPYVKSNVEKYLPIQDYTFDSIMQYLYLTNAKYYILTPKIKDIVNYNLLKQWRVEILDNTEMYRFSRAAALGEYPVEG